MAPNYCVDSRDVRFVLFELLETDNLGKKFGQFADFDREMFEEILNLAERLATEQIYPVAAEGDRAGCQYDPKDKSVTIPAVYHAPLKAYYDAGFMTILDSQEAGGMGMPVEMYYASSEYLIGASVPLMMYPGLSLGAKNLIREFGSEETKSLFLDRLTEGTWGGTMCLTEPDAGSDVGLGKSRAVRQPDGTYRIFGQNIFISSGDNDHYENMVHLKLARVEGDPPGSKGLSIFAVPKYRLEQGRLVFNDVVCSGIEHKMGIRGSSTCTLNFGDGGDCIGYLLGEERQGMKIMFHMMNEERTGVGIMGLALSSSAYLHAVSYARNRVQGTHVTQMLNPGAKPTTIINHPDVSRMLLWMKSHVEGMRVLCAFLGRCATVERAAAGEEAVEARAIGELLRPVFKAGCTDTAVLATSEAMQVYGGYGYCADYPVERLMRDSKITTIYEGTNGIQAMDFTMRKLLMNRDQQYYRAFRERMRKTAGLARGIVDERYVAAVEGGIAAFDETVEFMKGQAAQGKYLHLFMNATPLQQAMFMVSLAWAHLWALAVATPRLQSLAGGRSGSDLEELARENGEVAYYRGRVLSGQFYIGHEFPRLRGILEGIRGGESAAIGAGEEVFTGAPAV
ncbi:MAG: acyl-CoA dehydrogenase family protein [Spirochaetes bacterium]|nr:acyl-CoA dehydrogenase family protein [Spirochaetota bacterium]